MSQIEESGSEKVGFVYWCDGAGHAARCIPVIKELRDRGIGVAVGGGGQGERFVDMNGFDQPDFTQVTVEGDNLFDGLRHTVFDLIPSAAKRMKEVYSWMNREDPDKVISDDLFALVAAMVQRREFYRIDHLTTDLFGPIWGIPLKIYNKSSLLFGEQIIVTSLWKEDVDSKGITGVDPLAQEGESDDEIEEYDVLINPGTHGKQFDEIQERLEEEGLDVRAVGDSQWETKKSMTPYTEKADVVICTGFSSIADTVVAGTKCIVYPFLPFQKAIAHEIDERQLQGLFGSYSPDEVVETALECVEEEGGNPEYENGAGEFVDQVMKN